MVSLQTNNLYVIREESESHPAVSISTPKASGLKISPKIDKKKAGMNRNYEDSDFDYIKNLEFECESTHAQYSSDLEIEHDDQHSEQDKDCNASFCGHESIESFGEEIYADHSSLFDDEEEEEYQTANADKRICGKNSNNRLNRFIIRNEHEFQTIVKPKQQDHFMDTSQLYLPSIECQSQEDQATLEEQNDDDCFSTSSLCFSSFSHKHATLPDTLTTEPQQDLKKNKEQDHTFLQVEQQQSSEDVSPPDWDELKNPLVELLLKFYNAED